MLQSAALYDAFSSHALGIAPRLNRERSHHLHAVHVASWSVDALLRQLNPSLHRGMRHSVCSLSSGTLCAEAMERYNSQVLFPIISPRTFTPDSQSGMQTVALSHFNARYASRFATPC